MIEPTRTNRRHQPRIAEHRLRRFLYLMSPEGQLSSHPVMGMLWIFALCCVLGALVLAASGRHGWVPLLICAAVLIFNMALGSLAQMIFEEFIECRDDEKPAGHDSSGPGRSDKPPEDGNPKEPPRPAQSNRHNSAPIPKHDRPRVHIAARNLEEMEKTNDVSVSHRMLVAYVQKIPSQRQYQPAWLVLPQDNASSIHSRPLDGIRSELKQ